MYEVIIVSDESRNRSYYYSYLTEKGNIQCDELPPYADQTKARSCYWNDGEWIYDEDKYNELQENLRIEYENAIKQQKINDATPTNAELAEGLIDVANVVGNVNEMLAKINERLSILEGGN